MCEIARRSSEHLKQVHDMLRGMMRDAQAQAERLRSSKSISKSDGKAIARNHRSVTQMIHHHHHLEEALMFSHIKRRGIDIANLFDDHRKLEPLLEECDRCATGLAEDPTPELAHQSAAAWVALQAMLLPHLKEEEDTFTPEFYTKHWTESELRAWLP